MPLQSHRHQEQQQQLAMRGQKQRRHPKHAAGLLAGSLRRQQVRLLRWQEQHGGA
jgi:hypothetical protein